MSKLLPREIEVKPYPKNAKKHPDAQLKQIALSLKEYGWQQPIVTDKTGTIIVGHGRYAAYKKYPEGIAKP
jgi:ParB-like chromosome segregation protein Spo0J